MKKGRPIAEAPHDGSEIVAEIMNYCGVPATGHHSFRTMYFQKRKRGEISGWKQKTEPMMTTSDACIIQWWPLGTAEADLEKTPRTNWNFIPSNGTCGDIFYSEWCERCIRERPIREDYDRAVAMGLGCDIYLRSMAHSIGDAEYPTEWTYAPDGVPKCTAFNLDTGEPTQEARCDKTIDMFTEFKPGEAKP